MGEIAGMDVTNALIKQLKLNADYARVYGSSTQPGSSEREAVSNIKETVCGVAVKYGDKACGQPVTYTLPDGQKIEIDTERFSCAEILFKPELCGVDDQGLHEMIKTAILKCDVDIREMMWSNIVLSGGNSLLNGLDQRLIREVQRLAPASAETKVIAPPERGYSSWIGGSILVSMSTFEDMWITQEEYKEAGPSIVSRKCFM